MSQVYLGLPAYNERDSIQPLFEKILELANQSTISLSVIFYDDGCTDGTKEEVQKWNSLLKIIYIDGVVNKGLGTGMNAILSHFVKIGNSEDVLAIMDCDDTHDPAQIPQMLEARKKSKNSNIVIASRYRKGALIRGVPAHRVLLSIGAAFLYKIIHPLKSARDYTCGYRLYTYELLKKALAMHSEPFLKEKGFACMVELLLKLKKAGAKVIEVPLLLRYDSKRSASKMDVSGNASRLLKKLLVWSFY